MGEAERVPAEGSGAHGGVKRRAVEALPVKVGGKTRSGLSLTRPGPSDPFFVGEGNEKNKVEKRVPFPCFLSSH